MNKKVLIVCYSFPPFPGIGGRRWAKFAKYFAKNGVECHIVNAYNFGSNKSLWDADVESPHIFIHTLKFHFQYLMGLYSNKPAYRLLAKLLRTAINLTVYSPYFSVSLSRKLLQNKCIELIKQHKIDTVIASGDPYMNFYVSELKKSCPVTVILDYRDLWNDFSQYNQNKYHKLTPRQRAFFEFSEKKSLENCDKVVCVYETMTEPLIARSGKKREHFLILPNGFDKDDYPTILKKPVKDKVIKLYYGGSVSGERGDYFSDFLKAYSNLRYANKKVWKQFNIFINCDSDTYFNETVSKLNDSNIIFEKKLLSGTDYIQKLEQSDFGILPVHDDYADLCFSTKVYDYFYLEKPIIHMGKKGKVSEFIEKNSIGFSFSLNDKGVSFFQKLLDLSVGFQYPKEVREKITEYYAIEKLSLKYLDILDKR